MVSKWWELSELHNSGEKEKCPCIGHSYVMKDLFHYK